MALPSMAVQLNVPSEDSIWIVNTFQLAVMMLLLPFASMGELWGYEQVYLCGIIVFTAGSVACVLSTTQPVLVVSRVVQGIGAAMLMSVVLLDGALIGSRLCSMRDHETVHRLRGCLFT